MQVDRRHFFFARPFGVTRIPPWGKTQLLDIFLQVMRLGKGATCCSQCGLLENSTPVIGSTWHSPSVDIKTLQYFFVLGALLQPCPWYHTTSRPTRQVSHLPCLFSLKFQVYLSFKEGNSLVPEKLAARDPFSSWTSLLNREILTASELGRLGESSRVRSGNIFVFPCM